MVRVESKCGVGGSKDGRKGEDGDKEGFWVFGLGELGGWWDFFCNGDRGGRVDLGKC